MIDIQPVDVAILLVSAAACLYCFALNRRLKALQDTRDGLGSSIKAFSQSVSAVSSSTHEARLQTGHMVTQLSQLLSETEIKCDNIRQLAQKVDSIEINVGERVGQARADYESLVAEMNETLAQARETANAATTANAAQVEALISGGKKELELVRQMSSDLLSKAEQLTVALHDAQKHSDAKHEAREVSAADLHMKRIEQLAATEADTHKAFDRTQEQIREQVASIREEWGLIQVQQKSDLLTLDDARKAQTLALAEAIRVAEQTLQSQLANVLSDAAQHARDCVSAESTALANAIASAQAAHQDINASAQELESHHRKANARIVAATAGLDKLMTEALSEAEQKVTEMTGLATQMTALTQKTTATIEAALRKTNASPAPQTLSEVMFHDVS